MERREFLQLGLGAMAAFGTKAIADVTPPSGSQELPSFALEQTADEPDTAGLALTEDNILGPYHRKGAPYRAKITPPLAEGTPMLVRGVVYSHKTKKPIPYAGIDIWQANHKGRYDNDDRANPPKAGVYENRARLLTDENGYYEYETIMPGRYLNGKQYRPAHIHYWVRAKEHQQLITQLYFQGDPFNKVDPFIKKSLIIHLKKVPVGNAHYLLGEFPIVLAAT